MKTFYHYLTFFVVLTLTSISSAWAHKIQVFAYESGGTIVTEAKFNSGRPAKNSTVLVFDDSNQTTVVTGQTDEKGIFRFTVPPMAKQQKMDLQIVVDVGEGHRGTWLLGSSDYLIGMASGGTKESTLSSQAAAPSTKKTTETAEIDTSRYDMELLEEIISQTVSRELEPIKRLLSQEQQKKLSFKDILGGLGYIFGFAGIIAYFSSKNREKKDE